ncbi:MAG: hypothetical protein J5852_02870, partial [Clostridia bacterium]|nr:hypothetical protein [Clostridia bacterium]
MAKKSKHENNGLSEGFGEALQDDGADLLAEKNKDILSSFGKGTYTPRTSNQHTADGKAKPLSPIEALQSKVLQKSTDEPAPVQKDSTEYNEETSAKAEAATVADGGGEKDVSLLEKLKRYTTDETGHDVSEDESPLYKLESVAQIIKNDSSKLINKLSEKYDVTIDTLGKPTKDDYLLKGIEDEEEEKPQEPQVPETAEEAGPTPTPEFERMAHESKKRFEKNLFDELFGEEAPKAAAEVKSVPDISDIDNIDSGESMPQPDISGATVRFTPVADRSGNTGRINISSSTKPIDI